MRGSRYHGAKWLSDHGIIPAHAGLTKTRGASRRAGGIIPAHAGLTVRSSHGWAASGDHPRACGAHRLSYNRPRGPMGSSPRMRGSLVGSNECIGNGGDHPRACGAHAYSLILSYHVVGSSPRMRGSHRSDIYHREVPGIIPAHAGLTLLTWTTMRRVGDHPRACGAHLSGRPDRGAGEGSSPRMRGSR